MTLVLAAFGRDFVVLVSDRRVSADDASSMGESTKAAVFTCRDARNGVAFTGLAELGSSFRTRQWMLEAIADSAPPDCLIEPTLQRLREKASNDFGHLAVPKPTDKRLTLMFVGYRYEAKGPRAYLWFVTNFDNVFGEPVLTTPRAEFELSWSRDKLQDEIAMGVCAVGSGEDLLRDDTEAHLGALMESGASGETVRETALDLAREAADHPDAKDSISKEFQSLIVPVDEEQPVLAGYHPDGESGTHYFPSGVSALCPDGPVMAFMDPEVGQLPNHQS